MTARGDERAEPSTTAVERLLRDCLRREDWDIRPPPEGSSGKEVYVAQHGATAVFIKFDVDVAATRRLAELGVAPRLMCDGRTDFRSWVVQEYLIGRHPGRAWFSNHIPELAALVRRYHTDETLRRLAAEPPANLARTVDHELGLLAAGLDRFPEVATPDIRGAFERFIALGQHVPPADLVPTHPDPNINNMLLADGRPYLVDWDEVPLSHPGRDIGPLLWWYIPKPLWPQFFREYAARLGAESVYWWAARTSLAVAIELTARGTQNEGAAFLGDFVAAAGCRSNPRAP